jgi:DNA adenine methylase
LDVTYPGGKNGAGVYQAIINRMPPHSVYIEPFLGGGALMRLKRPAALNIGLDRDAIALRRFRRCWPASSRLAIPAAIVTNGGAVGSGRIAAAGERGSTIVGTGGTRDREIRPGGIAAAGVGSRKLLASSPVALKALAGSGERIQPVFRFQCGDAFEFLRAYRFTGAELVYCDPPYMHETRGRRNLYKFELTDAEHAALLDLLCSLPCRVMLSGYWTPLYAARLKRWESSTFQTVNRAGARTTEWLWVNFSEPLELHDYAYLGEGYRERERIKRKKLRWVSRLRLMPVLERRALLAAIGESWSGCVG